MSVLLLRLAGPMQSWGTQSRFTHRDTEREPSKSGVVGLLCAARGIGRDDRARIAELAALRMGVRVDREGIIARDFHTAGGGSWPGRDRYGVWKASGQGGEAVTSHRYYLAEADFLVALEGDCHLLAALHGALADPLWPLYLGRKAFVPGLPVWLPDGLQEGDICTALRAYPWRGAGSDRKVDRLRLVLECGPGEGQVRWDVPVCFASDDRQFGMRYVKHVWIPTAGLPVWREAEACISRG